MSFRSTFLRPQTSLKTFLVSKIPYTLCLPSKILPKHCYFIFSWNHCRFNEKLCIILEGKQRVILHILKSRNTPCLSPQNLHRHFFRFLLGHFRVPRGIANNNCTKIEGGMKPEVSGFRGYFFREPKSLTARRHVFGRDGDFKGRDIAFVSDWLTKKVLKRKDLY